MHNVQHLITRLGVIHLFATGRSTARNAVIQVSVVRFSVDKNPKEKTWVLNPGRRITQRLYEKTGLTNDMCVSAPKWADVRSSVHSFLDKIEVLFFVDTESRKTWLDDIVLKDLEGAPACVDLATMAYFFLPGEHRTYIDEGVSSMASWSKLPLKKKSQRALAGARMLLKNILDQLLEKNSKITPPLEPLIYFLKHYVLRSEATPNTAARMFMHLFRVAINASNIKWSTDEFKFEHSPLSTYQEDPSRKLNEILDLPKNGRPSQWKALWPQNGDSDDETELQKPRSIDPNYVLEILSRTIRPNDPKAPFNEPRPGQKKYVRACSEAFAEGGLHILEGGTGTGKTLGYLLPACQFAITNRDHQVYIASTTINLAEQLNNHEWPKLPEDLRATLKTTILLGKRNYLCRYAVMSYLTRKEFKTGSPDHCLAWLYMYMVLKNNGGIIEEIPRKITRLLKDASRLRGELNAEAACTPGSCDNYESCTYCTSLKKAEDSNIVFTTHHKLVLHLRKQQRQQLAICIIDEADQFAENARSALKQSISEHSLDDYIRRLLGRRGFLNLLKEKQPGNSEYTRRIDSVREDCEDIKKISKSIVSLCKNNSKRGELRWHTMKSEDLRRLYDNLKKLGDLLDRIANQLELAQKSIHYEEEEFKRLDLYKDKVEEWASSVRQMVSNRGDNRENRIIDEADQFAENARSALKQFISEHSLDDYIRHLLGRRGFLDLLEAKLRGNSEYTGNIDSAREDCGDIKKISKNIAYLCRSNSKGKEVRWHTMKREDLCRLYDNLKKLGDLLDRIANQLEFVQTGNRHKNLYNTRLNRYKNEAEEWASLAKQMVSNHGDNRESFIHTFVVEKDPRDYLSIMQPYSHRPRSISIVTLNLFKNDLFGKNIDKVLWKSEHRIESTFNYNRQVLGGIIDLDQGEIQFQVVR